MDPAYALGIDVGSTTVKFVVCDRDFQILAKAYRTHDTRQAETLLQMLEGLERGEPALFAGIRDIYMTGSGATRILEALGARFVQEVNAVVLAVEHLHPEVRSVIELGGQDAKIIHFKEDKEGRKSVLSTMNDKCASGTGATIEKCAMKVGMERSAMQRLRFDPQKLHHVAAKCGVFAETDIVNLLKSSIPSDEIMNSLADAIVMQNLTVLTRGNTLMPTVLLLGGPNTYLPFLQEAWRVRIAALWEERGVDYDVNRMEQLVVVPDNAQYYAALGAVIFGSGEGSSKGNFSGLIPLRTLVTSKGVNRDVKSDSPLVKSAEELEAFRVRYTIPLFEPEVPTSAVECFLGIDGGSTSSKAVLVDIRGKLLFKAYQLSRGNPIEDTLALLDQIVAHDPKGYYRIRGLGVTGYAADVLEGALYADANIIETIAHMKSAQQVFGKGVDVICDIGGQDIKVLFMEHGMLKNFRLSNQCSAGNGSLLQAMAKQFGVAVEHFAEVAFAATEAPRFNYGCAVFLDTDRVNFQKEGYAKEALFAGIAKVLPKNVWQYVVQAPNLAMFGKHFVLQGGTQYNQAALKAQVDYIRERVPEAVVDVHPHPGEAGAIGAALEAREQVLQRGKSRFVGLDAARKMRYESRTDESTRCHFCTMHCSRTFIDTQTPASETVRYIAGFSCEDGTVESPEALQQIRKSRQAKQIATPNLVKTEAAMLFEPMEREWRYPDAQTRIREQQVRVTLGGWGPTLRRERTRLFVRSSPEVRSRRATLKIAIPQVLNIYSVAPFMRAYLEATGIDPTHIYFSGYSNEDMYLEGARYGSVDACYPAKLAQSHVYALLHAAKYRRRGIDYIWFPAITHLPGFLEYTMGQRACPIVSGTPKVVRAAFTKERDLFALQEVAYVDHALHFEDRVLLEAQLWQSWGKRLDLSHDENHWAVERAWEALAESGRQMEQRGRRILDQAEQEGEVVLLLLGRPYHSDPGINHEILDAFQSLGYKSLSMRAIPKEREYLMRFFAEDLAEGVIDSVFDIRDVWPENFSTNSAQKVWAAKFAARHPNVAVIDLSSFKCGHDAPTYAIIDKILGASRTPHLTLHDIDANKPGGSINIRVKTFAYTLEQYKKALETNIKSNIV